MIFTTSHPNSLSDYIIDYTITVLCGLLLLFAGPTAMSQAIPAIDNKGTIHTIFNGMSDWALENSYVQGQYVVRDNAIYHANAAIPVNTPFAVSSSGATWTLISASMSSTLRASVGPSFVLENEHSNRKLYIEPNGSVTIDANRLVDGFSLMLINHSGEDSNITFTNFTGVFNLNCAKSNITTNANFKLDYLESVLVTVTIYGTDKHLNIHCMQLGFQQVANEMMFDGTDDTDTANDAYYYISKLVNGAWKVTRLDKNDVNADAVADISNNPSVTTQPTTLGACSALSF